MGEETLRPAREPGSQLRSSSPGSPSSTRLRAPLSSAPPPTIADVMSPTTEESMATPNSIRSVDFRSPKTPASEASEGWSAVGKATISGRSGRVIERLQSDLDQAKRDNKALKLSYDELHTSHGLLSVEVESLRSSAETNESIVDSLQTQAARKDRKIKELREDLIEEKSVRQKTEVAYAKVLTESEKRVNEAERQNAKAQEMNKYHQTQYEVVSESMQQLRSEYERKCASLKKTSSSLVEAMRENQRKLASYEADARQLQIDHDGVESMNRDILQKFEQYKVARDQDIAALSTQLANYREKMEKMERDVHETVGGMRHVMGVKRTFKGKLNDDDSGQ